MTCTRDCDCFESFMVMTDESEYKNGAATFFYLFLFALDPKLRGRQ